MNELALFAGAGGGILGGILNGWETVCAVERDAYAAAILAQRQNDRILDPFPIWSDVCTFDGRPWKGIVDIVSGGFPCQDISVAGKQEGITGKRSGLWSEMARIIWEVEPEYVWIENSPNLKNKGLETVLEDIREMGYHARWGVVSAENAGAPHQRKRIWILAHSNRIRLEGRSCVNQEGHWKSSDGLDAACGPCKIWDDIPAPNAFGSADGLANWVDRLKAIGNGQVPAVVRLAWEILNK